MIASNYRMNFLKHEGAGWTYKHIAILLVVWLVLLSMVGGVQQLRVLYSNYALKKDKIAMLRLNKEKEKRITIAQMAGVQKNDRLKQKDLYMIFLTPPKWSEVLSSIGRSAPRHLRLKEITGSGVQPGFASMKIKGIATSVRVVTDFIMRLEATDYFKRVELIKTEWNAGQRSFEFEVVADAIPTGEA